MTAKRIQETALKYFAEKGYDATTLADIAGEIGIKKPSIYAHYTSKMDLFMVIVEEAKSDYFKCWQKALSDSPHLPADQQLYQLFKSISQYFIDDKVKMAFWVRLLLFPPADCSTNTLQSLKSLNSQFIDEIARIFEDGIAKNLLRQAAPYELAHAYFCLLDGYLMRAICYHDFDYKKSLPPIWECFFSGIKV